MTQGFLARVAGKTRQIFGIDVSAGAADAGKIPAFGPDGRLHLSMMPAGIGVQTTQATASEAIGAGKFVNFFDNAGGVVATPLDETDAGNVNKISQYLGVAKSTTELVTNDDGYVVL